MIRLLEILNQIYFDKNINDIIYRWLDMEDYDTKINAGKELENLSFPSDFKYIGPLYRVIALSKKDFEEMKRGKKEIIFPLSSWSKSIRGVESIYNQDYFSFNNKTHIGVIFKINNGDVIIDIQKYLKNLPKDSILLKKFTKNQLRELKDEEEVIIKSGQKINKSNLYGYFDPEGWGIKKI